MLRRVGLFHFGKHHDRPTEELRSAMSEAGDVCDSLIVLPEAFNIRKAYRDAADCNTDRSVLRELKAIAKEFHVSFVAGLIIEELFGCKPPHSAAYLIDEDHSKLMCYKIGTEDTDGKNYTSAHPAKSDFRNPMKYKGVNIGALICIDSNPNPTATTYRQHRARADKVVDASDIICVPAHITHHFDDGRVGSMLGSRLHGIIFILANSNPYGADSFTTDRSGTIVEPTVGRDQNKIVTKPLIVSD
jgi:predicted amidohydrolase